MPEEFSRTTARKKIILPGGEEIYIPVITQISFIDPFKQYQEYQYQIDNTAEVERTVHVDSVSPVEVDEDGAPVEDTPTADTSQELFVERIDTWNVIDPFGQHQESRMTLDNVTGNDQLPPHFSNHTKTHIYRYHQDPQNPDDDGVWVDSELLDQFAVIDPFEQYQERQFTLINPTNAEFRDGDLSGQASEDDPDLTIGEGEGTEDVPVRIDPFQNIVNYNGRHILVRVFWLFSDVFQGGVGLRTGTALNITFIPSDYYCISTYTGQTVSAFITASVTRGVATGTDWTGSTGFGNIVLAPQFGRTDTTYTGGPWSGDGPNSWSTTNGVPPAHVALGPFFGGRGVLNWTPGAAPPGNIAQSELPTDTPWSQWGTSFVASTSIFAYGPDGEFIHGLGNITEPNNTLAAHCAEVLAFTINFPAPPNIVFKGTPCTPIAALYENGSWYIMYKIGA